MAGILDNNGQKSVAGVLGASGLFVRGLPYTNTAAKFWVCLMDEVIADYPADTGVVLAAPTGGLLGPDLLTPEAILERDLNRLSDTDARAAFEDALKALEIVGPPSSVRLRLLSPAGEQLAGDMALDYLDAEVLPFLLAWLLEWASVPDVLWNGSQVRGDFVGEDQDRRLRYLVVFQLHNRHLSEGLFDREIVLNFRREALPVPVPAAPPA
jgi:hypothetical protein